MKKFLSKVVLALMLIVLHSNVVFADGAPSYNKNMYSVVVNNPDGAILYEYNWNKELKENDGRAEYGQNFIVEGSFETNGETYLTIGGEVAIATKDVEMYGELVLPSDLRINTTK